MEVQSAAQISLKQLLRLFLMCVFQTVVGESLNRGEIQCWVLIRPCDSTVDSAPSSPVSARIRPHRLADTWLDVQNKVVNQMCATESLPT